jgi:hypothetical protein
MSSLGLWIIGLFHKLLQSGQPILALGGFNIMREIVFESEVSENWNIPIPSQYEKDVPPLTKVTVKIELERKSNGALDYYMSHPIKIEGFPPFDRDEIYSERIGL